MVLIPGLSEAEVHDLLASSEYAAYAIDEIDRLQVENQRLKNALVNIESNCGGHSINNGTSTLGMFCRMVLRSVGDSRPGAA